VATPASLSVSHPSGVCRDPLRGPPAPLPRDKGFADANEFLLAFEASFTTNDSLISSFYMTVPNMNAKFEKA
jgi:hypothetical protein